MVWGILTLASSIASIRSYEIQKEEYIAGVDARLTTAAQMLPKIIPDGYHDNIIDKNSVSEEDYLSIVETYNILSLQLDMQYLWSVIIIDDVIRFTTGTSTSKNVDNGDHASFFDVHTDPAAFDGVREGFEPEYSSFHNMWGDGRMVLIPHIDNKGRRYIFGASVGTEDVNASLNQFIVQSLILFLFMLAVGFALTYLVTRRMLWSFTQLTQASEAIAEGKYNKELPILGGSRELESLAKSINVMRQKVQQNESKLQKLVDKKTKDLAKANQLLEDRVEKRTQELTKSEQRFSSILAMAPEAIITADQNFNILLFSRGAERIFGYDAEEIKGKNLELLIPNRFHEIHKSHIKNFLGSSEEFINMNERRKVFALRKNGKEFPARASISKLMIDQEELFTVLLYDMTNEELSANKLLKAKKVAELANRAKTDFLANMSHELRTPLNAVLGYAQLIESEITAPSNSENTLEYATIIRESGEHLLDVLNEILDISKIELSAIEIEENEFDILELINFCIIMVKERADNKNISINLEEYDAPIGLRLDGRRTKQIILNILSNAIKFTNDGGEINITANYESDGQVSVTFKDNGIGIPKEDLERVMEPFVQAHGEVETRGNHQGIGVGLALIKSLTSLQGGSVSIESELGEGTAVTIHFPADRVIT